MDVPSWVERLARGDKAALARAITLVENRAPGARELVRQAFLRGGSSLVVGLTGPPGVGKSTLASGLARAFLGRGRRVGVLAVDPTSPFSGGAILGDRIRMQEAAGEPGVFIRSLATRGHAGGLCRAIGDSIRLLEAAGFDPILVETVGAGQGEVEVMRYADTVLVLLMPGLGDDIQAIKAGILEIGDVFVVNKADLPGADRMVRTLELLLELKPLPPGTWRPPVLAVVARDMVGVEELTQAILDHAGHLKGSGGWEARRAAQAEAELGDALQEQLLGAVVGRAKEAGEWGRAAARIRERQSDPYTEAWALVERFGPGLSAPHAPED
ncbi:MAG: methylmalonyl Co-A mutase-associated GTPase MeaB [Acetobacteraceae bacterium]|nr:methylmalonyl Co-A mutase-associated GTPase MeaB [Acetobacteraceae bacterium]